MEWIRPSRCEQGSCVEVAFGKEIVAVRNSEIPGEIIWFTRQEWEAFLAGTKIGEFNL